MNENSIDPSVIIRRLYREIVSRKHPNLVDMWPITSGADVSAGRLGNWSVYFFRHTGNPSFSTVSGRGELPKNAAGFEVIDSSNIDRARESLYKFFRASPDDGLILIPPDGGLTAEELERLMFRHEYAMGIVPMRIFLSHKSHDKTLIRDYKQTLEALGYHPWLDEDAMAAGVQLDRAILQGMKDSCAAVFFITPRFSDEKYLASEINYAIAEQRKRPDHFSIITLLFSENGITPEVPGLLYPFVWKEPESPLAALREIIRALPIKLGDVRWR